MLLQRVEKALRERVRWWTHVALPLTHLTIPGVLLTAVVLHCHGGIYAQEEINLHFKSPANSVTPGCS